MPTLSIIIGSTRPGRTAKPIADWFETRAREHGGFDVQVLDLAAIALPFMDEPNHPILKTYTHEHTRAWSETIEGSDAFVFVSPEYNFGYSAPIKNAIDFLWHEWNHKPVGFVSYGGMAGGTRSVQQLKQVVSAVKMSPLLEAVHVPFHTTFLVDGRFEPDEAVEGSAQGLLNELVAAEAALSVRRQNP